MCSSDLREEPVKYAREDKLKRLTKTDSSSSSGLPGSDASLFAEGDHVHHERFGKGIIISIEGEAPNTTASVKFDTDGTRKLLLRFAKLRKL